MRSAALRRLLPAAAMTFGAGSLFGFLAGVRATEAPAPDLAPDLAAYESAMNDSLDLAAGQRKDLRLLLLYYEKERNRIFQRQRVDLEPELAANDERFYELIKNRVLRPDQRRAARELVRGWPVADEAPRDARVSEAADGR